MKITFLGTGTSHGVPSIDCMMSEFKECPKGVCAESFRDPRHSRTRCSILVEYETRRVLVDVSADFRQQALRERIPKIDAVLITHSHADHIGGIPDIRSYTRNGPLTFYGSQESVNTIRQSFGYIFAPPKMRGGGIPDIALCDVIKGFPLFGMTVTPLFVEHGSLLGTFGYRIGDLAYIPDLKSISDQSKRALRGLQCLVVDALRDERPHSTHMILPESIALARELGARKTYFTHMSHCIHYKLDSAEFDDSMNFAYDGLQIDI